MTTDLASIEVEVLWTHKASCSRWEYEDACCYDLADDGTVRLALADGATEAFDARRWADLLSSTFVAEGVLPSPASVASWLGRVQHRWATTPGRYTSYLDQARALEAPTYCTLLGVLIEPADHLGRRRWTAVGAGDCLLVQVRDGHRLLTLPDMSSKDFGYEPHVLSSDTATIDAQLAGTVYASGCLDRGDVLLLATDAYAQWALASDEAGSPPWSTSMWLTPSGFRRLVDAARQAAVMPDDDVTLAIVRTGAPR